MALQNLLSFFFFFVLCFLSTEFLKIQGARNSLSMPALKRDNNKKKLDWMWRTSAEGMILLWKVFATVDFEGLGGLSWPWTFSPPKQLLDNYHNPYSHHKEYKMFDFFLMFAQIVQQNILNFPDECSFHPVFDTLHTQRATVQTKPHAASVTHRWDSYISHHSR